MGWLRATHRVPVATESSLPVTNTPMMLSAVGGPDDESLMHDQAVTRKGKGQGSPGIQGPTPE